MARVQATARISIYLCAVRFLKASRELCTLRQLKANCRYIGARSGLRVCFKRFSEQEKCYHNSADWWLRKSLQLPLFSDGVCTGELPGQLHRLLQLLLLYLLLLQDEKPLKESPVHPIALQTSLACCSCASRRCRSSAKRSAAADSAYSRSCCSRNLVASALQLYGFKVDGGIKKL